MPSPLRPCADCPTLVRPPTVRCKSCAVAARRKVMTRQRMPKPTPATSDATDRARALACAAKARADAEELAAQRRALMLRRARDWGLAREVA